MDSRPAGVGTVAGVSQGWGWNLGAGHYIHTVGMLQIIVKLKVLGNNNTERGHKELISAKIVTGNSRFGFTLCELIVLLLVSTAATVTE